MHKWAANNNNNGVVILVMTCIVHGLTGLSGIREKRAHLRGVRQNALISGSAADEQRYREN